MNELITGLNGGNVPALDIIMLLTFAALLPSIVVMMSSFMRIIIILSFFFLNIRTFILSSAQKISKPKNK